MTTTTARIIDPALLAAVLKRSKIQPGPSCPIPARKSERDRARYRRAIEAKLKARTRP